MRRLIFVCLFLYGCASSTPPISAPSAPTTSTPTPPSSSQQLVGPSQGSSGEHAEIGKRAPSFFSTVSVNTKGNVEIPSHTVTLVFFWATWNGPCAKAFPRITKLYETYRDRGFTVAALSVDDEAPGYTLYDFAQHYGGRFPVGWDQGHVVANRWNVPTMPMFFLVDRGGIVRATYEGFHEDKDKEMEADIVPLLEAP